MAQAEVQEPLDTAAAGAAAGGGGGKVKGKTEYVILASVDLGKTWTVEGEATATSKANALSHFYEERDLPENTTPLKDTEVRKAPHEYVKFQAIPKSSWKALKPAPPRPRVPFAEE
ncbi:MAG: hypothetical protein ACJ79H_21755 [Myxococcales bacterium]